MYSIVKSVIKRGDYDLAKLLEKINGFWVQDRLTDDEHKELVQLARDGAKAKNSVDVVAKLAELEMRVAVLEQGGSETNGETVEETPTYEAGKWYYNGDAVSFEGKRYVCTAPAGTVCVWSPNEYPSYWELVA